MWFNTETQTVYEYPTSVNVGNTYYPKTILTLWSEEELKTIGIFPYESHEEIAGYFAEVTEYTQGEDEVYRPVVTYTPKRTLPEMIDFALNLARSTAHNLLSPTDWMVIRETENPSLPVPVDVKTYRSDIRAACNNFESRINIPNTSYDALVLIVSEIENPDSWPTPPVN